MLFENKISNHPFNIWLINDTENRRLISLSIVAIFIQFLLFKYFYPFPNFMPPDSNCYLEAAARHQVINIWPIGYSWFLRSLPFLTRNSTSLVWLQYFVLQISLLYFLFSIRYLLALSKWLFRILLILCVFNPLMPHIANFVSSDALFASLSLVWFTQLLWILYYPKIYILILHALVLLFVFTVRYSALYYPIITIAIVIFDSHLRLTGKAITIGTITVLLSAFILFTQNAYYKETGTKQFAAFGGWQIAANALYGYAHVKLDSPSIVPQKFQHLHRLVNEHMQYIHSIPSFLRPDRDVGIYYQWDFNSPLVMYMNEQKKDEPDYFVRWARVAPLYSSYGRYLIVRHPVSFAKNYVVPNFIKYYTPPVGFMGYFNMGKDTVDKIAVSWFGWKKNNIFTRFKGKEIGISKIFPIGIAIVNFVFLLCFVAFNALNGFRTIIPYSKKILCWTGTIWFANMVFSVFSAPIELRYQVFPLIFTATFLGILLAFIIEKTKKPSAPSGSSPINCKTSSDQNIQLTT